MTGTTVGATPLEGAHGLHLLGELLRIRRFEERCVELYSAATIRGFVHLYIGEEAVADAVGIDAEGHDGIWRPLTSSLP